MEEHGFSLRDRVAVVTGGGRSLGLAISRALRDAGAEMVIAEVNDQAGPDVAEELEGTFVHTDVTDPASVRDMVEMVLDEHGRIDVLVNNAGMSGIISNHPQPQAAYNASKAGVITLTKSLAGEWASRGIRVNSVSPGYIRTPLTELGMSKPEWSEVWLSSTPLGRLAEPHEIAPAVLYLASDSASFATGTNLVIDGGYTSW